MRMNTDLQDLVDSPDETLDVEYKQWIDLRDTVHRANIARHIAAIANHGGGYIVFGVNDDMSYDQNVPDNLDAYSHDQIAGIVKKFLTPAFHCDVHSVASAASGLTHPIVRVPSHGTVPVCALRSGPDDKNHKPQGIVQGTYYVRELGPKSAPVIGPDHWQPIIKRCVLFERESLLKSLTQVLAGQLPKDIQASQGPTLVDWHEACRKCFLNYVIKKTSGDEWPVPIHTAYFQLSYRILHDETVIPKPNELLQLIHQANVDVKGSVYDGWSMFYPIHTEEDRPKVFSQEIKGVEFDGLETNLLRKGVQNTGTPDFWRIACLGWATLIRPYFEDKQMERRPCKYLDPNMLAKDITEFLLHAVAMAIHFPSAHSIELQCIWVGLENRTLDSMSRRCYFRTTGASMVDQRKFHATFLIPSINASLTTVVAEVANSVLKVFDGCEYSPEQIESLLPSFRTVQ